MTSDKLIDKLEALGLEPRSYSGRGMMGAYCVGAYVGSHSELPSGLPGSYSTDNLGRGLILYWPSVSWPKGRA